MSAVQLYKINPAENMARFYRLDVQPALFVWSAVYEWGRIGAAGTVKLDLFSTEAEAQSAVERKRREKERRGYVALRHHNFVTS